MRLIMRRCAVWFSTIQGVRTTFRLFQVFYQPLWNRMRSVKTKRAMVDAWLADNFFWKVNLRSWHMTMYFLFCSLGYFLFYCSHFIMLILPNLVILWHNGSFLLRTIKRARKPNTSVLWTFFGLSRVSFHPKQINDQHPWSDYMLSFFELQPNCTLTSLTETERHIEMYLLHTLFCSFARVCAQLGRNLGDCVVNLGWSARQADNCMKRSTTS